MGFPFLHKHILYDHVLFPISDLNKLENIRRINAIYFDCTGLLYSLSYTVPSTTIINNPNVLLNILKETIIQYIDLILNFPNIEKNQFGIFLLFDGKSPTQKQALHSVRDENIAKYVKTLTKKNQTPQGLGSIQSRSVRYDVISNVAKNIKNEIMSSSFVPHDGECVNSNKQNVFKCDKIFSCKVSMPEEDGESDIKILKILNSYKNDQYHFPAIVTCDSDVIISLESLRRFSNNVVILLKFPFSGHHCIITQDLNTWLDKNSIQYKFILFYFMFFFGCDYEVPIASGTKNQILKVYNFVVRNNCKLSTKLLLKCWTELNIKSSKKVKIKNLNLKTLCDVVKYKRMSVLACLLYYVHGKDLPKTHVTLLSVYNEWKLLVKNITISEIKHLVPF